LASLYRWVEHTSELELAIEAPTEEAVFADAVLALGELLGDGTRSQPFAQRVRVMAPDRPALLAEFVGDLVFRAEMEGFVPRRLAGLELGEDRLESEVEGCAGSPRHLVKAVTYHGLRFERAGQGWEASLVLDV
jgi:SHS2 domain-containing protein